MIRGVSFEIQQRISNTLWQLLKCIDIENYCWFSIRSQEEVLDEKQKEDFFKSDYYEGKDFSRYIKSNCYLIFLKLEAYCTYADFKDIQTYNDFKKSDCEILILLNDCEFFEIYCKNANMSQTIYDHAIQNNYKDVNYITDENDGRKLMNVL